MTARLLKFRSMVGFFIKKAFFDGWDNLIGLVLFNIGYIVLMFIAFWLSMTIGQIHWVAGYGALILSIVLVSVLLGGTASVAFNYSDYKHDAWAAFRAGVKRNIRHSLLFSLVMVLFFANLLLVIPFYASFGNIIGYIISVILIWVEIIIILAVPYYFPLMNLLPADKALKTARKCLLIVGGNMGFTFFYLLYSIFCLAVTLFTVGIIPGITGMQLASQDAMKLLMFKYDYLEENPDADPKHIPWEDLLYEEKEKVGPRSLKSMIFPWKY